MVETGGEGKRESGGENLRKWIKFRLQKIEEKMAKRTAQQDRDFDVCTRCGTVMYEGTPFYLLVICVPCWDTVVNRQQQQAPTAYGQMYSGPQPTFGGHQVMGGGGGDFVGEGPIRCSSPKLDFRLGKPHMRIPEPDVAPINPPKKPRGRPPGKEPKKDKHKTKHSKPPTTKAATPGSVAVSSLSNNAQQLSIDQKAPDPSISSPKSQQVPGQPLVSTPNEKFPSQPVVTSSKSQEVPNQSSITTTSQEVSSQSAVHAVTSSQAVLGTTRNEEPGQPLTSTVNGDIPCHAVSSVQNDISTSQTVTRTVGATITTRNPTETVPKSKPTVISSISQDVEPFKSVEIATDQQQVNGKLCNGAAEPISVSIKRELIESYKEPEPVACAPVAHASDMDVDDVLSEISHTDADISSDEPQKEGYMRHFYCYFCIDDVLNEKIDNCEFCKPVWSTDKLCNYDNDALREEFSRFTYKEGKCVICFGEAADTKKQSLYPLCKMCEANIEKALS